MIDNIPSLNDGDVEILTLWDQPQSPDTRRTVDQTDGHLGSTLHNGGTEQQAPAEPDAELAKLRMERDAAIEALTLARHEVARQSWKINYLHATLARSNQRIYQLQSQMDKSG